MKRLLLCQLALLGRNAPVVFMKGLVRFGSLVCPCLNKLDVVKGGGAACYIMGGGGGGGGTADRRAEGEREKTDR